MLCVVEMRHLGVTSLASANRVPEVMDYKRSQLAGNLVIKHSDGTGSCQITGKTHLANGKAICRRSSTVSIETVAGLLQKSAFLRRQKGKR